MDEFVSVKKGEYKPFKLYDVSIGIDTSNLRFNIYSGNYFPEDFSISEMSFSEGTFSASTANILIAYNMDNRTLYFSNFRIERIDSWVASCDHEA